MSTDPVFPDDANGDVLRRMVANGVDLGSPRNIDFEHIFSLKAAAVAFLAEVASQAQTAQLSWYQAETAWNVRVTRHMIPSHADISSLEAELEAIARRHGGAADGWGCFELARSDGS